MTNKYVTTPCILHFPRYTCVGEENKVCCEGGRQRDNTARKNQQQTTTHVIKHACQREPHPYPHSSIESKHREVQDDGKKKAKCMGRPLSIGKQWYGKQLN